MQWVGMWHTHPESAPVPSDVDVDVDGMARITRVAPPAARKAVLLIVGQRSLIGVCVFDREQFVSGAIDRLVVHALPAPTRASHHRTVGLALSGGGARAMAFHLGCLRALQDRGVLDRIAVVSGVSGGAIIAGMYAYGQESFADFDARVVALLRKGLLGEIVRALLPSLGLRCVGTALTAGTTAAATDAARVALSTATRLIGLNRDTPRHFEGLQPPLRRWASRTAALEAALRRVVLGDARLTDPRRNGIDVVLTATDLRTGSAFRFGSRESGSWRLGRLASNTVFVAEAVAASAAYPVLLPALDRVYEMVDRDGHVQQQRVILSDGGIFDNLAVTCFEPGRTAEVSYNAFHPDYIVCCDAGPGLFTGRCIPYWWVPRMIQAFSSVFRKAQDGLVSRLHQWTDAREVRGFVLSYLGQRDERLPYTPAGWIRREVVMNYPTDFSAMWNEDLVRLTARGEQLTRLLLDYYCPEL